jgi:hypothetical protein|tara:strand:+ start:402 stop:773 length:372 start_codon:yes stop_codon:yes gene_type:complete
MGFVNERTENGQWQTIDREKNIVLSKVSGPDSEGVFDCEIIFSGQKIRFLSHLTDRVHGKPKLGEKSKYEMDWDIFRLFVPESILEQKSQIKEEIKEALEIWGWNYNQENAHSVSIQFSPSSI